MIIMKHRFSISILGVALAFAATPAVAIELRAEALIDGDIVTVGDLFIDAGDAGAEPVLYAPAPGETMEVDFNFLYRVARAFELDWRPASRLDRVLVRRSAQEIAVAAIEAAASAEVAARLAPPSGADALRVELDRGVQAIRLPSGVDATLSVLNFEYNERSRRFAITLGAGAGTVHQTAAQIAGAVVAVRLVPVLNRQIQREEIIGANDIDWVETDVARVQSNTLMSVDAIVGMSALRALRAGDPVRDNDVRAPVVVRRGEVTTMIYRTGGMTLTALGRALEDAAVGETVRVVNTQTSRTVEAVAAAPGQVRVLGAGRGGAIVLN